MAAVDDLVNKRKEFFTQRRGEVGQDAQNQLQQGSDALTRRFTSLGMAGSGAAIGADLKNREAVASSKAKALNDVQAQELQANEGDIGREFAVSEAQKGRDFQGGLAGKDSAQRKEFFDIEQGNKLKQLDLAQKQFDLDADAQAFNKRMAEIAAGYEAPKSAGQQLVGGISDITKDATKAVVGNKFIPGLGTALVAGKDGVSIPELGIKIEAPKCFFTTAACDAMNMEDDSWVLMEARKFRDTFMAETPDRAMQINDYYEFAPKIVELISKIDNPIKFWKKIFWTKIIPFVNDVKNNKNDSAYEKYNELIKTLKDYSIKLGEKNG